MTTHSLNPELLCVAGLIKIKTGKEKEGKALLTRSLKANPYQSHSLGNEANAYLTDV